MERSEPTLVPEWLRSTGSISGGGNSAHHCVSAAHSSRNGGPKSAVDKNSHRVSFLDRASSTNSRPSSSNNGSSKHPYSSFNRNHRDKNRDKEKEKSLTRDFWEHDDLDPLGDILINRAEKDALRRSRSLLCRKPSELLPRRALDLKSVGSNNHGSSNGLLSGGHRGSGTQRTAFEMDFPSLGTEEKQGVLNIGRVPSPGVNTAIQSLPTGNPGLIGGEGWTSALVEVPTVIGNNNRPTYVQQNVPASAPSAVSSPKAGLNMAEALSQAPARARTTPQLPDKTQMLEELAIKQSKQLIPVMPSMPKGLVHNSDKLKLKTSVRTSETVVVAKNVQQQPHSSQVTNQCLRGGQVRTDSPRSSNGGKFLVLKPARDNCVPVAKDVAVATNNPTIVATNQLTVASTVPSHINSANSSKPSIVEGKMASLSLNYVPFVEKRPSLSQAQSRYHFFNLMRKKTLSNSSRVLPDLGITGSSPTVKRSDEVVKGAVASASLGVTENGSKVTSNGHIHEEEKNLCLNGTVYPDEEETAFLRSLGWEENAGEDDGLTEEEINAFYEEYMKMKPSLKLCKGVEQKISVLCESHTTGSSRASSELSFSESEIDA